MSDSEKDNPLIQKLYDLTREQPRNVTAVRAAYHELRQSGTMTRSTRKKIDAVLNEYYWKIKAQAESLDEKNAHELHTMKLQIDCDCGGY